MSVEQRIVWITGQPGAGKSTLGRAMLEHAKSKGLSVFLVDGDDLRALTSNADYSALGREANIRRAQDIALYLSRQGCVVIVAVVAPFRWLREEFKSRANVREVYVHTSDVRGREHFHSALYEAPIENCLSLDTTHISVPDSVARIVEFSDL